MKRTHIFVSALLFSACATQPPATAPARVAMPSTRSAPSAAPSAMPAASAAPSSLLFERTSLDPTISACTDFYQYTNGGWLAKHPIPPQYASWSIMTQNSINNRQILREILEAAAAKPAAQRTANEQKLGDYYGSCMNEQQIDAAGLAPLQPELDRIAAIRTPADLQQAFAHMQSIGINVPFVLHATQDARNSSETIAEIYQAGLGLPDRDYYTRTDEKTQKLRTQYLDHMRRMFALAKLQGDPDAVMRIENSLALASQTNVEERDPESQYNRMPLTKLATLAPQLDWGSYLSARGLKTLDSINISQPKFVQQVAQLTTATPIADWQSYLRWHLLRMTASALPTPIAEEAFQFRNVTLLGQKKQIDRWQRCVARTDQQMGEALGQAFVDRKFPPAAKQRVAEMVNNLALALHEDLSTLDWMSDATRRNATAKLDAFRRKVGYPDTWRDYSALRVTGGPLVANVLAADEFETRRDLAKIGNPPDLAEWGMTPSTINAYYNPSFNEIVFPAGILQWPMFDINQDDAFNYGAAGSVIGHEITHGFDDQGSQYDAKGNLVNWWTETDKKNFAERAECIVNQFDSYEVEPGLSHKGKLVAGESIADLGGAIIAYKAWQKSLEGKPRPGTIDGFTPEQRFFLGFARARATNQTIEAMRNRVLTDPHPLNKFRVNGPVSNMPQFAAAFQCKAGDAMVRANRCDIW